MSAPFQPGDVVVCVDAPYPPTLADAGKVLNGAVYRIARLTFGGEGVQLSGVRWSNPYGLWAWRFRKIDDEVTEDFRQQLRSLKSPKPALNPSRHSRERVA